VLLPLAAVLINDVKTETAEGALMVEISTSDEVAASDIRVASGGPHKMFVYLDGSAAKQSTFGEGADAIVVHPRLRYTKLEIPTPERCGEPIGVLRTADGVRVRATCREASAGKGSVSAPARLPSTLNAERPLPDAPQAARTREAHNQAALRAALALPTEAVSDEAAPAGVPVAAEPAKPASEASKGKARQTPEPQPNVAAVAAPKVDSPDAPTAAVANQESNGSSSSKVPGNEKSQSGALTAVLAVALLLGAGIAAVLFARKRGGRERVIRIVETASIGPRRSLVVACVGGRTMVLGVSEAGVSLLDSPATCPAAVATSPARSVDAAEDAALGLRSLDFAATNTPADRPAEAKHESSLLGRLFHRNPREADGPRGEDFAQLFAESMEDEELRRKLAMGHSGRIA